MRALLVSLVLVSSVASAAEAPAEAERVSFEAAISRSLDRNPEARIAIQEVKRAWGLLEQARSVSLPTLSALASYTRLDGNRQVGPTFPVTTFANELTGSLLLTVPLLAPARWAAWAHARDAVEVQRLTAYDIKRRLGIAVAHTYLTIVSQHRVIDVQERARDNAQAHLDYTHARFAGGVGPQLDETRAAQELDADVSQLETSYAQIVLQQEALGVLLGVNHPVDSELTVSLEGPPELNSALEDGHKLRTDLRLATQQLKAGKHLVRDDYTDYLPTIVGTLQPFLYTPGTPNAPSRGYIAMLTLVLPLYDGGLRYGYAKERRALLNEAAINQEGVDRQVSSDVRAATVELERARRSYAAAKSSAHNAGMALSMTNQAYKAGATTNIEVIDAERAARDADTAAAVAEDAANQATIDLLSASGRFPEQH